MNHPDYKWANVSKKTIPTAIINTEVTTPVTIYHTPCHGIIKIFTLTYVKRHPNRDFRTKARKSRFLLQTGSADNQHVTTAELCQESREGRLTLQ